MTRTARTILIAAGVICLAAAAAAAAGWVAGNSTALALAGLALWLASTLP